MQNILSALQEIIRLLHEIKEKRSHETVPFLERSILSKREVIDKLGMSERTYSRNLDRGLLDPMRLSGADQYYEQDIVKALEESRRKGRV
ncbi:hypothetical protein ORI89_17955 [Sphingobacterium sp. UT-1RO-CII-1]|uniref:hypothetical protein n=1 Tax=Sphingobacterium sp. UT-1RO-CII-1 TaxID=2995225 RepID=UPI00227A0F2C|nr:hypothetical protein [Sphingobacterium sp. UT-1RO-CII-1]MCY4781545.1 hypothetical protein [Sphingobacterium sp. UT-1RO-CII-1]